MSDRQNDIDITLQEALKLAFDFMISGIHTAMPGRIESYDPNKQKASIKPLIKRKYGSDVVSMPIVNNVPVMFPRTANSSLTFPINQGDYVLLIFAERSMERWLQKGGEQEAIDPRKYDLTDGIAIPGLFPFTSSTQSVNNNDLVVTHEDQTITIKKNGDIELGGVPLRQLVTEDLISLYNAHTHPVSGANTLIPGVLLTSAILTQKTKAE